MGDASDPGLADLDALLSRYFEGDATADEVACLEAKLLADDQFAERASQWCLVHQQIGELLTEDALHEMMGQYLQRGAGLPRDAFRTGTKSGESSSAAASQRPRSQRTAGPWMFAAGAALAATILVGAGVLLYKAGHVMPGPGDAATNDVADSPRDAPVGQSSARADSQEPGPIEPPRVGAEILATLTRLVDAEWAGGAAQLRAGDELASGSHVTLESGLAKIIFECGAEVVLEGPCDFVVQSHMLGYLNSGKMTADVPRRAFGFAILSPGVDFVDLGTSFGVHVVDDSTELHVFDGEVLCSRSPSSGTRGSAIHVRENRAVAFASNGAGADDIAMDARRFSQLIALRRTNRLDAERLLGEELALWLAADAAVAADPEGRVISWQDILYGDNQAAEDAVQSDPEARPLFVEDGINGLPAVRFDGDSDFLLTTPLETTDDQTVLLVCQFSESALDTSRRWGGQIINYDGPPSRYLSNLAEPGVLQIGEPLLEREFQPTLITAQVFAGFIGSATVEVGRIDAEPVGPNAPVIIAYVYDFGRRQAELQINGRSHGQERAYAPHGITSRKIIGRHAWMQNFFHGDLAELLIYNKALSPGELAAATQRLATKYAIKLSDP